MLDSSLVLDGLVKAKTTLLADGHYVERVGMNVASESERHPENSAASPRGRSMNEVGSG